MGISGENMTSPLPLLRGEGEHHSLTPEDRNFLTERTLGILLVFVPKEKLL